MRLRTFGRLRLEGVDFTRPKPLLLLAYLALEGRQGRRHMAELFWPNVHDRMNSLTVVLARLRKGAPGAVAADERHVWAQVEADAVRLLELLKQRELEGALELYHGPFLHGFYLRDWSVELEEWVYATREFLATHARKARLELAEREAARARFEAAARHAEQAFDMADAGTEPEELSRLHTILLAGDSPKTAAVRKQAEGLGITLVELTAVARERLGKAVATVGKPAAHNLPARSTGFVGRDLELTEVASLLSNAQGQLLTLVGTAGVGKTRLALQVAREQLTLGAFKDGIYFVSLEALTTASSIPTAIADALGLNLQHSDELLSQLVDYLKDKDLLLVLDNFEHLAEGATILFELVSACHDVALLVTSRERLNLEGERIFPVAGMPFPPDDEVGPEEAQRSDAVRLFVQRARRVRPDFRLDRRSLPHVLKICRLVEGLPLGLELSAVWLKAMSVEELARELDQNLDMLASPTRDLPERHQSIRAAFEHSWRLLSAREQDVLKRLSFFIGGFRRDAAAEVAGATIPVLASLVDKSLLRVDQTGRFDRHPLLYQYIKAKLLEHPDDAALIREAHGTFYMRFLSRWQEKLFQGEQKEAFAAIEEELENLRVTWRWAIAEQRLDEVKELIVPLTWYFKIRGRRQEGIEIFTEAEEAVDASEPTNHAVLGNILTAKARLYQDLGRYEEATNLAQRGLALLESFADDEGVIAGLDTLGRVAWRAGSYAEAKVYWDKALDVAEAKGDRRTAVAILGDIAMIAQELGDYAHAERDYLEALAKSREYGNNLHVIRNLNNLGELYFVMDQVEKAEPLWREGHELAREMSFQGILPHFTFNLGLAAFELGNVDEAVALHQQALRQARELGDQSLEGRTLARLSRLAAASGSAEQAQRYAKQALELSWGIRDLPDVVAALVSMAELRARQGELKAATGLLSVALRHPATSQFDKDRTRKLLKTLRQQLSPNELVEAMEHGSRMQLERIVEQLIAEAEGEALHP